MEKLRFRSGLGLVAAVLSLPCIALAQPTAPTTTPPPTEPAPLPAPPVVPPPPASEPAPLPEPTPVPDAPALAPSSEPIGSSPVAVVLEADVEEAPAPAPTLSGYIEAAYHINFSDPSTDRAVPMHAYYDPPGNGFVLHAAHLAVNHSFSDSIKGVIEIDAGFDAPLNAARPFGGSFFDLQEGYLTYTSGIFSMTAGKFAAYQGIEVFEGPLNPTITRGFLYGYSVPFTHTGLKLHFTTETIDFGIGVVNGWDNLVDDNDMKTIIFKFGITPSESFTVNINGTFGAEQPAVADEQRLSLDLTGAWTASDSFALWFQGNMAIDAIGGEESKWYGFGLQPTYTSDKFTFGARVEYFADPDGVRTFTEDLMMLTGVSDASYINVTLTPGFIIADGFKIRAELRADISTEKVFGRLDPADLDAGKFQLTGALGAEYVF
jgi:hypothetical protein